MGIHVYRAKKPLPYEVLVRRAAVTEAYAGFTFETGTDAIYRILEVYDATYDEVARDVEKVRWDAMIACDKGIEAEWVRTGVLPKTKE